GLDERLRDGDVDLHLFDELEDHRGAAVELDRFVLAAVALDLAEGNAGHAGAKERRLHLGEPLDANDRRDEFHGMRLRLARAGFLSFFRPKSDLPRPPRYR